MPLQYMKIDRKGRYKEMFYYLEIEEKFLGNSLKKLSFNLNNKKVLSLGIETDNKILIKKNS